MWKRKMDNIYYFKQGLFDFISSMATSTGSKLKRLDKSFDLILHCLYDDKYLKSMQKHTKNMVMELREIYKDIQYKIPIKYAEKYGTKPQEKYFRPLRHIHYKLADKIIYLIINLYQNI